MREKLGKWVFGCDICQAVCPWNRFSIQDIAPDFAPRENLAQPELANELSLTPQEFNKKFKNSPVKRAKRRGYLRNIAVALGNSGDTRVTPALENALNDIEPLVCEHVAWALGRIKSKGKKC